MKRNWKQGARLIVSLTLAAMLLTGCATTIGGRSLTIPIIGTVEAVPCNVLRPVSYSAPETPGAADPSNEFDTAETIALIRPQNAAIRAICGERR